MHLHGIAANLNLGSLEAASAAQRSANSEQSSMIKKELAAAASGTDQEIVYEDVLLDREDFKGQPHRDQKHHQQRAKEFPLPKKSSMEREDISGKQASFWT